MADPLCRWRNSTPKNVCELVSQLPKTMLSSSDFRMMMKKSIYGDAFFITPYQLACQLGLYVENEGIYIPRFNRDITEEEASAYLYHWFKRYYVPNPYTKRGFHNMDKPVIVLEAFVDYLKKHNNTANFNDITKDVFGEPINNVDILVNCFNNYSRVIAIDKTLQATLLPNYEEIFKERDMDRIDKLAFFQQFENKHRETPFKFEIDEPLQLIYYGAPGTGKSYTIDRVADENNSVRTTFHPDSDYAGFVGAYKPTMDDVPMSAFVGKEVHLAQPQGEHTGKEKKIVYKYVPQAFLKAYVAAWERYSQTEDNPFYLVIEEINRGNCAQIFGDLFQLLDRNNIGSSSYAISADEDIARFLRDDENGFAGFSEEQKDIIRRFILKKDSGAQEQIGQSILDGTKLILPPNMRIWATMNTSDQSLFPIDSAFKRRWNWEYMPIDTNPVDKNSSEHLNWKFEVGDKTYYWGNFLEIINKEIETVTVSEDKQMGYFFAKPDKKSIESLKENDTISEKVFVNKVLFYLWSDVFKDYDLTKKPFIHEVSDREGKPINKPITFRNFFPIKNNKSLADFMANLVELGLNSVVSEDNTANTEEATKRSSGRKLIVEFPDGSHIKGDTQFDSYIQALDKIGLDAAADVITKKGYSRNKAPLISKEKYESIENSPTYSYVQIGDYYIIKGIDTMEGTLNGISKELGLELNVYFE